MIARVAVVIAVVTAWLPAARANTVVLAPLATLGEDTNSKDVRAVQRQVVDGLQGVNGFTLLPQRKMLAKLKSSKRDDLRNCDGNVSCLSQLGTLFGAKFVVYGEVGGVGEVKIAYLKLIDVANKRELRTTTLELDGKGKDAPKTAAIRLLAPERYTGRLALKVDVDGASVFVDGRMVSKSPAKPLDLKVGTHAIRVTHPEYRDFVRFVEVAFGANDALDVGLQQYPIVASDMRRTGGTDFGNGTPVDGPTPWYRRWYTIAGAGAVVFIGSAILIGVLSDGVDAEDEKTVR